MRKRIQPSSLKVSLTCWSMIFCSPIPPLGFIWHKLSSELVQSLNWVPFNRETIVSASSSANPSQEEKKINLIPESQSRPGDIFVPTWKPRKLAALEVTVTPSLQSTSLTNAATKAGFAHDAANEQMYCFHDNNCAKLEVTFVPLAIKVLGGIYAAFLKSLKRLAVLSDNHSFQTQELSVAF